MGRVGTSLYCSKLLIIKSESLSSLFEKEWCEWFAQKFRIFYVFDSFSPFYVQEWIAPFALHSFPLFKERLERFALFRSELILRSQKKSESLEKPMSKFLTLTIGYVQGTIRAGWSAYPWSPSFQPKWEYTCRRTHLSPHSSGRVQPCLKCIYSWADLLYSVNKFFKNVC